MTCQSCVDAVNKALEGVDGIEAVSIDLGVERVLVTTTLPSDDVKQRIEDTGRIAVLRGMGASQSNHLGAAVSEMSGCNAIGVVRMVQASEDSCIIEGTLDGLKPGTHGLYVHEYGDLSEGCRSCGDILDMSNFSGNKGQKYGELGLVRADSAGRAQFRLQTPFLKVWDVIGRSMVLHEQSEQRTSRVACGIIARSAGLLQNVKKICACDGVTIWDERNKPAAGSGRQAQEPHVSAQL